VTESTVCAGEKNVLATVDQSLSGDGEEIMRDTKNPRYHTHMRQYLARLPRSTEELLRWHERYIAPATLIGGFLFDAVIFSEVDLASSTIILLVHLCIAAFGIVLFHMIQSGYLRKKVFLTVLPFVPSIIQFSFGALFGGFVILYSQSAAYATSWIFIALLSVLLVGNERFRLLYTQFTFQASIYFAVLISYVVFFLPVIVARVGTTIFLISEAVAVGIMFLLLRAFALYAPHIVRPVRWRLMQSIGSILLIFNVLYFTNVIPPIPLALKEAGVYHNVRRVGDIYELQAQPREWYQQYLNYNTTFYRAPSERIYVFTAIFAPTRLSTTVVHDWERYDEAIGKWVLESSVAFGISGGREEGYRGYTFLDTAKDGAWRVNVKNGGKLIGRVSFDVESVEKPVDTSIEER
jgi:hypothetical protein